MKNDALRKEIRKTTARQQAEFEAQRRKGWREILWAILRINP